MRVCCRVFAVLLQCCCNVVAVCCSVTHLLQCTELVILRLGRRLLLLLLLLLHLFHLILQHNCVGVVILWDRTRTIQPLNLVNCFFNY